MVGGVVPDPMSSTEAGRVRRPGFDSKSPPAEPSGRRRRLWSVLLVCAGFAVFGAVVWMAYQDASLGPPGGEPPLIKAAPQAIKLPPDQAEETALAAEQGEVGQLWSDADEDQPERLLPLPEQPRSPPAGQPSREAASGANSGARVAALPSAEPGQGSSDAAPAQSASDRSLQEAEAALDRLLAEVTAVSEGAAAPDGRDAKPAEDTNAPAATAAAPAEDEDPAAAPPEPEDPGATPLGPAESPPSAPAATSAAAEPPIPAAPPAPPQKPARAAPATTAERGTDVRPAGAVGGEPSPGAQPRSAANETAALSPSQTPPIVADGDFRIQLAAVRGQADARRAWELFARDLGPTLRGVEPIFERADTVNGVFYRVQIGPFARQEAAESLCEQLKQHNASCFVIRR
jgi:SPOR domain